MKIAIHDSPNGFHPRWRAYCEAQGIPCKRVDCHVLDIVEQVADRDGLMWKTLHFLGDATILDGTAVSS